MDFTYGCRWEGQTHKDSWVLGRWPAHGPHPPISVMQRPKWGKRNCVFKEDVTFLNLRKRPWEVYIRIGFLSVFCGHANLGFVTLRNWEISSTLAYVRWVHGYMGLGGLGYGSITTMHAYEVKEKMAHQFRDLGTCSLGKCPGPIMIPTDQAIHTA